MNRPASSHSLLLSRLAVVLMLMLSALNVTAQGGTPLAPTNLQVNVNSINDVSVFWVNAEGDYDLIVIERRNIGGDSIWYPVKSTGGATVLRKDDGLLCQGSYEYRVYAIRAGVLSGYSNVVGTGLIECVFLGFPLLGDDGGFEGGSLSPVVWQSQNRTGDKVMCDKLKADYTLKEFSATGRCAFRFKGGPGENSMIQQKPATDKIKADDKISFYGLVRAVNLPTGAVVKVIAIYPQAAATSKPREKFTIQIPAGTYDYTEIAGLMTVEVPPAKLKFQLKNRATAGKVFFDNLSLFASSVAELPK